MQTVTLKNDFHNTEVNIRVATLPHRITPSQQRRIDKTLCDSRECECGSVRGPQYGPDGQRLTVDHDWDGPFDEHDNLPLLISERDA